MLYVRLVAMLTGVALIIDDVIINRSRQARAGIRAGLIVNLN